MIKVFITNLGAYNRGELIGKWVDLPINEEKLKDIIKEILNTGLKDGEVNEEVFITDYETDIYNLKINEYEDIIKLNDITERINVLDEYEQKILGAVLTVYSSNIEEALEIVEKGDYTVFWDINNEQDLGEYVVDSGLLGEIPDNLMNYIDFEAIGRDWCIDGIYIIPDLNLAISID